MARYPAPRLPSYSSTGKRFARLFYYVHGFLRSLFTRQRVAVAKRRPDPALTRERIDPRIWKIAGVVALGPLMSNLDATIVNLSLAPLGHELHTTLTTIQWVTSGYLLSLALALPLNGWLVDRVGARNVYLSCFIGFTIASLLCGLATSAEALIFFRVLQGITGGLLAPMPQLMMARLAGRNISRVMGVASMPGVIGPILGPTLAGAILQYADWRWIFLINLPIGIFSIILAWRLLPRDRHETVRRKFDPIGFLLLSPALALLLNGMERLGVDASARGSSGLELLAAVILLAAFGWHAARRGSTALIDLSLFRNHAFNAATLTQFLSNCLTFGGQMLFPLYFMTVQGRSPSATGLLLASAGMGLMCALPPLGRLVDRYGPRAISSSGTVLAMVGTLPFIVMDASHFSDLAVCALLFIRGVGLGFINIPSISAAYASIPRAHIPVATTTLNIVQRLGGPAMTMLLAIFLHSMLTVHEMDTSSAYAWAFRLFCTIHLLAVLAALRLPRWAANRETRTAQGGSVIAAAVHGASD